MVLLVLRILILTTITRLLAVIVPVIIIPLGIVEIIVTSLDDRIVPIGLQLIDLCPAILPRKRFIMLHVLYLLVVVIFNVPDL